MSKDVNNANDMTRMRQAIAQEAIKQLNQNLHLQNDDDDHDDDDDELLCHVTVMIVRHCNDYGLYAKDDAEHGDKHCSHVGFERTRYLASLFKSWWPSPPIGLYALLPQQQHGGINYRQIETLLPLAQQTNVSIQIVANPTQVASSIFQQLQQHSNHPADNEDDRTWVCGRVFVVAWKHAYIPDVAAALGCGPQQGCPSFYPDDEFDAVWEIRFVLEPPAPVATPASSLFLMDDLQVDAPTNTTTTATSQQHLILDNYNLLLSQQQQQQQTKEETDASTSISGDDVPSTRTKMRIGWAVYGAVTHQNFDPLHVSYYKNTHDNNNNNPYGTHNDDL